MKTNHILFVIALVHGTTTHGQYDYFNDVFSIEQNHSAIATNIELIDGQYKVLSQFINSENFPDLSLLTLDNYGVQVSSDIKSYGYLELTNLADALIVTSDNKLLWGGSYTEVDGFHAVLSKFDENFTVEWNYDYWNAEDAEFHGCTEISDGFVGYGVITVNENNDINDDYGDLLITKLNFDGSLAWQKIVPVFDQQYFLRITKAFEMPNGDLMVFGSKYYDWDYFAIKLDSEGNYLDSYTWGTPLFDWIPWPVDLGNGEFMVAWQESHYYYQEDEPGAPVSTPHLKKFDGNAMSEIWDVEYEMDSLYVGEIGDMVRTPDGGFLICGHNVHPVDETEWLRSGMLIRTDSLGEELWSKFIEYSADIFWLGNDVNLLYDIEITADGGFVACGTFEEHAQGLQQIWVVKGDCMGNLELPEISLNPQLEQPNDSTIECAAQVENLYNLAWDMGNGVIIQDDSISYSYPAPGQYTVTVSGQYCAMTVDSTFFVNIPDCMGNINTPELQIEASAEEVDDMEWQFTCDFQNLENIFWDFGDGTSAYGPDLTHEYAEAGTYDVFVCGEYCDSLLCDTISIDVVTAIFDQTTSSGCLLASPNPFTDHINLTLPEGTMSVLMYDMTGQVVFNMNPLRSEVVDLDLSSLPTGAYLIRTQDALGRMCISQLVLKE
jgi:hypothetical protein